MSFECAAYTVDAELVNVMLGQIPVNKIRGPKRLKWAIKVAIAKVAETTGDSHELAAGHLAQRMQAWLRSDEQDSEYCRGLLRWLEDECWEESDEVWSDKPKINPFTGEPMS